MKKLLLVALAAVSLVACGDDDDDAVAPKTTTTTSSTTTTSTPPRSTSSTSAPVELVDPADTARAWIAAIAGGHDDAAIGLTAPRSLEAIGGPEGFIESDTALAEGWGAWDAAEDLQVTAVGLDPQTAIVVLHGLVSQEGPPRESWAAVPVVSTGDGDRVEAFLDLGNVEPDPPAGSEIAADARLAAYVLVGREVTLLLDAGEPEEPSVEGADGDQQRAEVEASGLEPGLHVLTVVVRRGEEIMTRTFEYTV